MARVLREINFQSAIRLEVGSGASPVPGYIHCDVDELMPNLDIQCRMGEERLPLPDACCSEILSNHSIEHVPWVRIPLMLEEWSRVLVPGGKLFLRTPDLEFICRTYLEGKLTPESPKDEQAMLSIFGSYSSAHWANIKLFAGQDYPGNFHFFCLDFPMLTELLERFGFERVQRLWDQPVYSPGEICAIAFKK
jgi:predicted SAM-dependent methyltransferase